MKNRPRRGFTFIELVLAVSIFAIVAVALNSTFSAGLAAWKRAHQTENLLQDLRLALDKMAEELQNAVLYSEKVEFSNFTGEENRLSFYTLAKVFTEMPAHYELMKVTYNWDGSANVLQRLQQTIPESMQEAQEQQPEEVLAKVSRLNFFYCYEDKSASPPYKWENIWDNEVKIPQGVKIELTLEPEEKLTLSKYVFIPSGEKGIKKDE